MSNLQMKIYVHPLKISLMPWAKIFRKILSSSNYNETFQNLKKDREKEKINFHSLNHEKYNLPFTISELLKALQKSHDTAVGPDDIHYQLLKHLPNKTLRNVIKYF